MSVFSWLKEKLSPKKNSNPQQWLVHGIQHCVDGFWAVQERALFISPQLKELLGYKSTDLALDEPVWWLNQLHPEDVSKVRYFFSIRLRSKNNCDTCEFRIRHRHGNWTWCVIKCYSHASPESRLPYLIGTVTNITQYRLLHNQLERTIEDAERISQAKSSFISSFNHELRTPLVGIIGNIHLLEETDLSEEQKNYAQNISASAELLLSLINDVLDISKIVAGKLDLDHSEFTLEALVKPTFGIFRHLINQKNLSLEFTIDDKIPVNLLGDRVRIQQVLVNLLNNAVKFTSEGGIKLRISLAGQENNRASILFQIIDTGTGIGKEELPRLFQDFTQANAKIHTTHGGTGLGLSICKKLIGLMGGEIGVQSTLGKGSTFWFKIPLEISPNQQKLEQLNKLSITVPPLNILVADDNIINQQALSGLLAKDKHVITLANNGAEAVELCKKHYFNVVLMDINMPVMGGLEATKAIRNLPNCQGVLIYAATADISSFDSRDINELGFNGILAKPIKIQQFYDILSQHPLAKIDSASLNQNEKKLKTLKIDQKHLDGLVGDLGADTVARLLSTYMEEAAQIIDKIKVSSESDVHNLAHTLAGISENLGLKKMGQESRQLMKLENTNNGQFQDQIIALERCFLDLYPEIKNLVSNLSTKL